MTVNHYATLGLSPTSEDVVIRAAYLALMRRYHPDRNASAGAAVRARAIAAAYAVLGDPERRAEYDAMRVSGAGPMEPLPGRGASRIPGGAFTAASLALFLAVVFVIAWPPLQLAGPQPPRSESRNDRAAAPGFSLDTDPVTIAARDEPPPAVPEAPPAALQPEPAEQRIQPDDPAAAPPVRVARAAPPQAPKTPAAAAPTTRTAILASTDRISTPQPVAARSTAVAARPSFSCELARTRGEIAVCRNVQLANLDRQQALLYSQSWGRADAAKRAELLRTRERFVAERDSCRSHSCTSGAYLARMREVSEIMTGIPAPAP